MRQIERRFCQAEMRMSEGRIEGYAAVFDVPSLDLGGFREFVRGGAFIKTIKESDIRALFNHDPNFVLGRNAAGTLELAEDGRGLHFRVSPPPTGWANDLTVTIGRGDINQASFQFATIRDAWRDAPAGPERDLLEVRLYDVSVVTFPAYPQTEVGMRMNRILTGDTSDPDLINLIVSELGGPRPSEDRHRAANNRRRRLELLSL